VLEAEQTDDGLTEETAGDESSNGETVVLDEPGAAGEGEEN
jgi:hypothetical protein